jgi:hypothetical protein
MLVNVHAPPPPLSLKYNSTTEGQVSVSNSLGTVSVPLVHALGGEELDVKALAFSCLRSALFRHRREFSLHSLTKCGLFVFFLPICDRLTTL